MPEISTQARISLPEPRSVVQQNKMIINNTTCGAATLAGNAISEKAPSTPANAAQAPTAAPTTPTGPVTEEPAKRVVLADRYKTKLCNKFLEKGKCPYDRKCMFAHGEHELRTYEMNMMDGLTTEDSIRLFRIQQQRFADRSYSSNLYSSDFGGVMSSSLPPQYYQGAPPPGGLAAEGEEEGMQYCPAEYSNTTNNYYQEDEAAAFYHHHQSYHQQQVQHTGMYFYSESYYQQCYEQPEHQHQQEQQSSADQQELPPQDSSLGGSGVQSEAEEDEGCDSPSSYQRAPSRTSSTGSMYRYDPYGAAAVNHKIAPQKSTTPMVNKRGSQLREPVSSYP